MGAKKKMMECTAIKQLVQRCGRQKAGEMLGISPTNFSQYLNCGEAAVPIELAARYVLSKLDKDANGWAIAVTVVPADKRAAFDTMMKALELDTKIVTGVK